MWTYSSELLNGGETIKYKLFKGGVELFYAEVVEQWISNPVFCQFYTTILAEAPFEAFFWECMPVKSAWENEVFEFVLVNSKSLLHIKPERNFFEEYFYMDDAIVTFPNLSGDALLVVPTPIADEGCYAHMAAFVRTAPKAQQLELWRVLGQQFKLRVHSKPFWLSTAGLGVYWLHIRLDSRPKYYRHGPYKM